MTRTLSKEEVLILHDMAIAEFGGSYGVRDEPLLESAINAPHQTFGGTDLFPSVAEKAARLAEGIAKNHAFIDGNKRTALYAMSVFLRMNGIELAEDNEEAADLILGVACGSKGYSEILEWIKTHRTS